MSELIEHIQKAYADEQESLVGGFDDVDLPINYEAITPAWLTSVLCADAPGAEVLSLSLGEIDTGSSNRRKIAVQYNAAGEVAGLPKKLFCKASHDLLNRMLLGSSGGAESEIFFYNNMQKHVLNIEVPVSRFAKYNPHTYNSLIILDDISDDVESFCNHHTPMNKARALSQMDVLAGFHTRFYNKPDTAGLLDGFATWPQYFEKTLEFGMKEGSNQGFLDGKEVIPPALYARYDEIWPATEASIEEHNHLPNTFIHCDVHFKNWYVMPGDRMGLSDWQCCCVGHWGRDLAYTISTALTIEQRRLWEKDLIAYYVDKLNAGGFETSFEDAWDHYRKQLVTALTWWTITLSPAEGMPEMQPRDITLEFIRRITTAMDDLGTMDLFK